MTWKETLIMKLLSFLFLVFLIATTLHVFFCIFVPTAEEWPGEFPYIDDNRTRVFNVENLTRLEFWAPFLRHWSLFPEHFQILTFIDIINSAFLTMFIYKIGQDFNQAIATENSDNHGNPKEKKDNRKVAISTYVEWAMGALISGIIFASSRLSFVDVTRASISLVGIFVFSFVSLYFMYNLRKKLRIEEGKIKVGHEKESDFG